MRGIKYSLAVITIGMLISLFSCGENGSVAKKDMLAASAVQAGKSDEDGKLEFIAQPGNWEKADSFNILSVNTILVNNTQDTVSYISMSCSWQEIYTTDTKELGVDQSVCDKNVPILIKIPTHQKEERTLKLWTKRTIKQTRNLKFRVGLNLVIAKDYNEVFSRTEELHKMKNVIWSDTLQIR